jgi:hypothetical protein
MATRPYPSVKWHAIWNGIPCQQVVEIVVKTGERDPYTRAPVLESSRLFISPVMRQLLIQYRDAVKPSWALQANLQVTGTHGAKHYRGMCERCVMNFKFMEKLRTDYIREIIATIQFRKYAYITDIYGFK